MRAVALVTLVLALVPAAALGASPPSNAEECAAGASRAVVVRFITAFNARNILALDRIFAPAESFNWFSTGAPGARVRAAAYDRSTLMAYFKARHRQGEKLRLVRFKSNGNSNGYAHFEFRLERRARTLRPTLFQGKGAAICAVGGDTIAVWSVGGRIAG
jgi:hypothetical protein